MINQTAILGIGFYQRFLSPYKGFSCAHRVLHGGASCSGAVKALVRDQGLLRGWEAIRERFADCGAAAAVLRARVAMAGSDDGFQKRLSDGSYLHYCELCEPVGHLVSCGANSGGCDGGGCDFGGCDCSP